VGRGKRELEVEKQRSCSVKERVNRLERAMMKSEGKIDEHRTIIDEWERKESELRAKEKCRGRSGTELNLRRK